MKSIAPSATAGRRPILVIEDEPSIAAFLRSALERRGYDVAWSASPAKALTLLGCAEFSGVISDLRTPGGVNGIHVHEWLRQNRPELAAKMIFVTGDTASCETLSLLAEAQTPCIEKPFRLHQLIATVEKTIGKP
jgi:DNA-binding response OmpR family regulator